MRKTLIFDIIILVLIHTIICNSIQVQPKNMEELEESEDWEGIQAEICRTSHSKDIQQQIEKCNELDPYYKFDSLSKQCDKLRAPPGSIWYDEEKGECQYNECYAKLTKSTEFTKLSKELDNLPEDTQVKKAYEKYKCIRKVLGLKV